MIEPKSVNAALLCGGRPPEALKSRVQGPSKAFIRAGGRFLMEYVADALRGCPAVDRVVSVGDIDALKPVLDGKTELVRQGETIMDNLTAALRSLDDRKNVLLVTSDVPLVTAASFSRLLEDFAGVRADVHYPIISRARNEETFPGMTRTYLSLREGRFTGGNVLQVRPGALLERAEWINRIFDARKSPLKLLSMVGVGFIFRLMTKSLTIEGLERKVGEMLDITVRAVETKEAEIAVDVDKPSDLDLVESILSARAAKGG